MKEEAITFGEMRRLVGVVTEPSEGSENPLNVAVVLLNSGIVHRVGPGRIYVKMARELAADGFTTLRFDLSGIGDSLARHDSIPFEKSAVQETQDAMDFLQMTRGIERFVLLGGCSGAYLSLETARHDLRVIGTILLNFPIGVASDGSELADRHAFHYYYNFAISRIQSWRKFLTGRADYSKITRAIRSHLVRKFKSRQANWPEAVQLMADLRLVTDRGVRVAFVNSEGDPRLDDLLAAGSRDLREFCSVGKVVCDVVPKSDHTFTSIDDHSRLLRVIHERLSAMCCATALSTC